MRVKKISGEWTPSEKKDLQIGEIIDISDAKSLVEQGLAIYVDENDQEYDKIPTAWEFKPKEKTEKVEEKVDIVEDKKAQAKAALVERLKKGREEKKKKELEKKLKEQEKVAQKALEEAKKVFDEKPL